MKYNTYLILVITTAVSLIALATPAHALECANVGAEWVSQPDDSDDPNATACGDGAVASGNNSTALGNFAASVANESTALGFGAYVEGTRGVALGYIAFSGLSYGIALGAEASADGASSVALGHSASTNGSRSTALGYSASSSGSSSVALGDGALSDGLQSTAIGFHASAPNPNTVVIGSIPGINDVPFDLNPYANVAIGTTDPQAPLHVTRADGTSEIFVEETSAIVGPRTLFTLANPGNTKFEIMNTDAMNSWAFTNSGLDFRVSLQGSGVIEFRVDNAGNAYVANDLEVGGTVTTNLNMPSDIGLKQNIESLDPQAILEKVVALPVQSWEYKKTPGVRHIGPMAQDFQAEFGLGADDTAISVVDASGVALSSIQALEQRNGDLERRVAYLEALLNQLLPKVAQN